MSDTMIQQPTAQSAALERVIRQVLDMKRAGDIEHLIREVWDVLEELDFYFLSCAFLLIDEERDWLTSYSVWEEQTIASIYSAHESLRHVQRLGEGLIIFSGQTSLTAAPSLYQEAIAAWRRKSVERHLLSATEIEEMARLNSQRYGGPITVDTYPVRFHLHVPFAHGVFSLRTDRLETDQFSDL